MALAPSQGWADADLAADPGLWGFGPYLAAQDYFLDISYAPGAAFTLWSLMFEFSRSRRKAMGGDGGVSWGNLLFTVGLASFLRWAVCFLLGCCGSPMLAVYASIFGAKAFGIGKLFVALISALTTGAAYVWLSRRSAV